MVKFSNSQLDQVFLAYDIRGQVPDQLNEEFYEQLGKAFVTFLNAKKIAVGYDIRPDSKVFTSAFIKGATSLGCDCINVGEISTEMIYFITGARVELDGGAVITASHNPAGWNGCKMVGHGASPISEEYGLKEIKELMLADKFQQSSTIGKISEENIYPAFKEKILSFIGAIKIKPLKIVVDAGNGIGGKIFDYVFGQLPLDVIKMYFEPDGMFPNHVPDPLKEENVAEIKERTVEEKADIGIAIDGDADRVFFIDNKGRNPSGVYTGALFARYFLKSNPGEKIIHCVRVAFAMRKEAEKAGGIPIMNRVGHSPFKKRMKEEKAIFAAEMSSHFYYRDFYNADSGMITIALMLKMLSQGLDFDKEMDYMYETYPDSGEVNYVVDDVQGTIEKVEAAYKDGKIIKIDGVSVEYDDWRFNLRPSNTQPLIRLNVEGKTEDVIVENFRKIEKIIGGKRDNLPRLTALQ